ncbi:MAG: hypothetical protein IT271_14635 [Chitinophagales bacterium]|nr:hypothetical protein [Chitinophagales bacterium]
MGKNHPAKSGSMLTQKTNEDYNKKSPSLNDVSLKQSDPEPKVPKKRNLKKQSHDECIPIIEKTQENAGQTYLKNAGDSYAMQIENRVKNVINTNKICKHRFS